MAKEEAGGGGGGGINDLLSHYFNWNLIANVLNTEILKLQFYPERPWKMKSSLSSAMRYFSWQLINYPYFCSSNIDHSAFPSALSYFSTFLLWCFSHITSWTAYDNSLELISTFQTMEENSHPLPTTLIRWRERKGGKN